MRCSRARFCASSRRQSQPSHLNKFTLSQAAVRGLNLNRAHLRSQVSREPGRRSCFWRSTLALSSISFSCMPSRTRAANSTAQRIRLQGLANRRIEELSHLRLRVEGQFTVLTHEQGAARGTLSRFGGGGTLGSKVTNRRAGAKQKKLNKADPLVLTTCRVRGLRRTIATASVVVAGAVCVAGYLRGTPDAHRRRRTQP